MSTPLRFTAGLLVVGTAAFTLSVLPTGSGRPDSPIVDRPAFCNSDISDCGYVYPTTTTTLDPHIYVPNTATTATTVAPCEKFPGSTSCIPELPRNSQPVYGGSDLSQTQDPTYDEYVEYVDCLERRQRYYRIYGSYSDYDYMDRYHNAYDYCERLKP